MLETLEPLERFYLLRMIEKRVTAQTPDEQIVPLSEEIRDEFWKSWGVPLIPDEMKELMIQARGILRENQSKE